MKEVCLSRMTSWDPQSCRNKVFIEAHRIAMVESCAEGGMF